MDERMDEVVGALADPVRRRILTLLHAAPMSAGQVADRFEISRPAVSRHLRVLREAGLVHDRPEGRRRVYALEPAPLGELADWLARLARPSDWERRLAALETEIARTGRDRRTTAARHPTQEEIA